MGKSMIRNETIIDEKSLYYYEYYIWEVMRELRAAEGLDAKKIEEAFKLLNKMTIIYEDRNQIDKIVLESFITIPGNMFLISKEDKEQGKEIELASQKLFEYRKDILEKYKKYDYTIVDKSLINNLRENSIGKEGFLTLVDKNNIFDKQKVNNTFEIIEKMIDNYRELYVIDKEVAQILISIYEYIFVPNVQENSDIDDNVSAQFQRYLRKLVEVQE